MSNFRAAAYHPDEDRIRTAMFFDDAFGRYVYGVQFDEGGPIYRREQCEIPPDRVFVPEREAEKP